MRVENIYDMETLRTHFLRRICIRLQEESLDSARIRALRQLLSTNLGGNTAISIRYERIKGESGELNLGASWKIRGSDDLIAGLEEMFGASRITMQYDVAAIKLGLNQETVSDNSGGERGSEPLDDIARMEPAY